MALGHIRHQNGRGDHAECWRDKLAPQGNYCCMSSESILVMHPRVFCGRAILTADKVELISRYFGWAGAE